MDFHQILHSSRIVDIITCDKCFGDRFWDVDSLEGVKNGPFPLTKPVAVNTADATAQLSDKIYESVHVLHQLGSARHMCGAIQSLSTTCALMFNIISLKKIPLLLLLNNCNSVKNDQFL